MPPRFAYWTIIVDEVATSFRAKDRAELLPTFNRLKQKNPGAGWVKLEVLGDKKTLLPDPVGTPEATRELFKEGFTVLAYTSDDPRSAVRIKEAGAASVMPAGSPIGSGQGVLNPLNISLCLELLKEGDPTYPVIVDAGSAPHPVRRRSTEAAQAQRRRGRRIADPHFAEDEQVERRIHRRRAR